jgi:hypothetical protein
MGYIAPMLAFVLAAAVGVNVHLPPNDTLDLAVDLGAGWVRIDFNWNLIENEDDLFAWGEFDRVIDAAEARGVKVFATVGYGPAWASTGDRRGDGSHNDVPDAAELAELVATAVARYATRVDAWGTWNEPNLDDFFEGSRQEWIDHAFVPTVDAIRATCPSCTIVGPEVATIGEEYQEFLEAALDARGAELDAISWHIYSGFPEEDSAAGVTRDSFYNKLESHRVITIGGAVVYEGQLSVKEVLDARGVTAPVWVTECGRSAPMTSPADLESQRRRTELIVGAMASRPWWTTTMFYELSEEHPDGLWPDVHWGLALRVGGPDESFADNWQTKPAYDWLKAWLATPPPGPDGGVGGGIDGGMTGAADGGGTAGGADAAGPGVTGEGGEGGGCGCRVGRADGGALSAALALAVALGVAGPCRRRRRGAAAARRA